MIKRRNRKNSVIRGDNGFLRPHLWDISAQYGNKMTLLHLVELGFFPSQNSVDFNVYYILKLIKLIFN